MCRVPPKEQGIPKTRTCLGQVTYFCNSLTPEGVTQDKDLMELMRLLPFGVGRVFITLPLIRRIENIEPL
jgi:hypothetical protein